MPRLKLIFNPVSDRGDTAQLMSQLKQVIETKASIASQTGQPYEVVWATTNAAKHAIELAAAAADEGFDRVVAIGGDGTVHEVVNGLMQIDSARRPLLGIVPVGSGNDFAHNLDLPSKADEAANVLFGDTTRTIDIGTISDDKGHSEYWNNTVGLGFAGAVNIVTKRSTIFRGFLIYLSAVVETILFKPQDLKATYQIGGGPEQAQAISMLSICNGPREGGGFPVAPDAKMDDGLLTYVIMRRKGRLKMFFFLPIVMLAQHMRFKREFEGGTTTSFSVKTDKTMAIHTDGEVFGAWEARISGIEVGIIPGALTVLCDL